MSSISTGTTPSPLISSAAAQKPTVRPEVSSVLPPTSTSTTNGTLKRKADNDRNDVPFKNVRQTTTPASGGSKSLQPVGVGSVKIKSAELHSGVSSPARTRPAITVSVLSASTSSGKMQKSGAQMGRGGPGPLSSSGTVLPEMHNKARSSMLLPAPLAPATEAAVTSTAPLRKGSYKEIMARAQALKAQQTDIMQITHKPVAKMTKKERLAHEADLLLKDKKHVKDAVVRKVDPRTTRTPPAESHRKVKQPIDLGYSGTMRAQVALSKLEPSSAPFKPKLSPVNSFIPSKLLAAKHDSRPRAGGGRYTYASYSDEEDEEAEDDYDSESDMEAGGLHELEREEMVSLQAAKVEDAQTLRELEEHDRMKRERKRKLEQLAAAKKR